MNVDESKLRRELTIKAASYPKKSAQRRVLLALLKGAKVDPEDIAKLKDGPHEADPDDKSVADQFTQQGFAELRTRQESGELEDGKPDTEEKKMARFPSGPEGTKRFKEWLEANPEIASEWTKYNEMYEDKFKDESGEEIKKVKKAGWRALKGGDRKLFAGLVRLAKENDAARDPVMQMLAEQGLLAKKEVPEAFKKQWEKDDKDGDGKKNDKMPEGLKKHLEKKDKKAGFTLSASQALIASKAAAKASSKKQAAKLAFDVAIKRGSDVESAKAIGLRAASLLKA